MSMARFDKDGTAHLRDLTVPLSDYLSPEAKAALAKALSGAIPTPPGIDIATLRAFYGAFNDRYAERMKQLYPVAIAHKVIGGVRTEVITPEDGVAPGNNRRVLINLHGGAFVWGEGSGGEVESIPIASLGRITVITVAYRMGPENRFPAASEDVAAVYRALLADHDPEEIGIYGASAGGILTAQSTAWIIHHGMPRPGAIGTFCGSLAPPGGDTAAIMQPLTGGLPIDRSNPGGPYFAGADYSDPLVMPVNSPDLLAKFPPTLLLAGSRDFLASSLYHSQRRLDAAGVETDLHIWDGLPHGFFVDPDLPESREVYDVIVKFFERRLRK